MSKHDSIRNALLLAFIWAAPAVVLMLPLSPTAQELKPLKKTESVTAKVTIEAIDKTNRLITLKGPRGNLTVVEASDQLKRFDELKVGDEVTATYTESLAVHVRKPGEPAPPKGVMSGVNLRQGGPGATATVQQTVTVTIEEIDRAAPAITVKAPDGDVLSFRVREPKRLENLKIGDKVDVTYTRSLLISADPVIH